MFQHVLLFKFRDPEVCAAEVGRRLLTRPALIPEIADMTYHTDELHGPRSYDACLIVTFRDRAGYEVYDKDPHHNEVRKYIHAHVTESHTADYSC